MFEKKIKKFFDSVSVCGEEPTQKIKIDKRLFILAGVAVGSVCVALGAGLSVYFLDKSGKEALCEDA